MYESFYGLKEKPFRMAPDPRYLYMSREHRGALTYLEYGLMEDVGFILLTGEVGSGKTTLIRHLLKGISKEILTAVIFNTNFSGGELLDLILQSFDLTPAKEGKTKTLETLYEFLIQKYSEGKRMLLVIDEAQNLSREALDEVRMLSNLQSDDESLLQIMLVGQPELRVKLRQPQFSSFSQRVAVQYHLPPLTPEEVKGYIAHRLKKAGGRPQLFRPEAVEMISRASGGIPRMVNLLCDAALVYGFGYELKIIGTPVIKQVIKDRGGIGIAQASGDHAAPPPEDKEDGDENPVLSRIEELEAKTAKIQIQLEWQIEELERKANGSQKDLIVKLGDLLNSERKRSDKLLIRYTKLWKEHKRLLDEGEQGTSNEPKEK